MINIYEPKLAKIIATGKESIDTSLLRLKFVKSADQKNFNFIAGQFMQIGISGWGECPISICSSFSDSNHYLELAIRDVGQLTHKLTNLKKGDLVYLRGPFGNGFPVDKFEGKNLVLIGGGCGFVPLRPLIIDFLSGKIKSSGLQIFYGCLSEETMLFKSEYPSWNRRAELGVILDKPSNKWKGERGLITELIKKRKISKESMAVLVGPPIMYRFVLKELIKFGLAEENIFLSLERKMYCGVGVCQHCAIGPYYVCKDGPVFSYAQLKNIKGAI
jgi:sulfhydrogenase subunit gamma (sulfur reductase)